MSHFVHFQTNLAVQEAADSRNPVTTHAADFPEGLFTRIVNLLSIYKTIDPVVKFTAKVSTPYNKITSKKLPQNNDLMGSLLCVLNSEVSVLSARFAFSPLPPILCVTEVNLGRSLRNQSRRVPAAIPQTQSQCIST